MDPRAKGNFKPVFQGGNKQMSNQMLRKVMVNDVEIEPKDIKKGMELSIWETDGTFMGTYIAASDSEPCPPEGNYMFDVEPPKKPLKDLNKG